MKKSELIATIADRGGYKKKDAEKMLNLFTEIVAENLAKGEKVTVSGFGIFSISERAARDVVNPNTKKISHIEARKSPVFRASKVLKETVNSK
ncbi:MAG: HU family DNA-binding protein [Ruminococcus sp.]|nr:HU family DNA-binding protein [Ruminococcus sp.]